MPVDVLVAVIIYLPGRPAELSLYSPSLPTYSLFVNSYTLHPIFSLPHGDHAADIAPDAGVVDRPDGPGRLQDGLAAAGL